MSIGTKLLNKIVEDDLSIDKDINNKKFKSLIKKMKKVEDKVKDIAPYINDATNFMIPGYIMGKEFGIKKGYSRFKMSMLGMGIGAGLGILHQKLHRISMANKEKRKNKKI